MKRAATGQEAGRQTRARTVGRGQGSGGSPAAQPAPARPAARGNSPAAELPEPEWESSFSYVEGGEPDPQAEPGVVTLFQAAFKSRRDGRYGEAPLKYRAERQGEGDAELLCDFVIELCMEGRLRQPSWLTKIRAAEAVAAQRGEQQHSQEFQDFASEELFEGAEVAAGVFLLLDDMESIQVGDRSQRRISITCKAELIGLCLPPIAAQRSAAQRAFQKCMAGMWGEEEAQGLPLDEWTVARVPHERRVQQLQEVGLSIESVTGGKANNLTTVLRLLRRGAVVGKALMTYHNGEMGQWGPALEHLEIAAPHRRQGLGRVLLREVERLAGEQVPPLLPCDEVALQLVEVTGSHAWFRARGFRFLDSPLDEEAVKTYHPDQQCSCGQCVGGWLSRRMAVQLCAAAEMERESLQDLIQRAEADGSFGGKGPGNRTPLSIREALDCDSLTCLPINTQRTQLFKSFLQGYAECLDTIALLLSRKEVPSVDKVLRSWQSGHWSHSSQSFFLERGGSVEAALTYIIDRARHMGLDQFREGFYDEDSDLNTSPRCAKDFSYNRVARELLGPDAQLGRPGCPDCGTWQGYEDEEESEGDEEEYGFGGAGGWPFPFGGGGRGGGGRGGWW